MKSLNRPMIDIILGIRPDVIRASILLKKLQDNSDLNFRFIWSGQHYSNNLKDIFFNQLEVFKPDFELNIKGRNDGDLVSDIIRKLSNFYEDKKPVASIFLGDTNTVMGSIAAMQANIPIVHIEGCMRSYDWEMPEEKYRTVVDHISDVIYAYFEEYKQQGILEGIRPDSIMVTQNLIVDILNEHFYKKIELFNSQNSKKLLDKLDLKMNAYYFATIHRRENIEKESALRTIFDVFKKLKHPVVFAAGYRTQKMIKLYRINPINVSIIDPIGYNELLTLVNNCEGVISDSGTLIEECSVLGIPAIQARRSTERAVVYDVGGCIKLNPHDELQKNFKIEQAINSFNLIEPKSWTHKLGDGFASNRIYNDLLERIFTNDGFLNHKRERYHLPVDRAYQSNVRPQGFEPQTH